MMLNNFHKNTVNRFLIGNATLNTILLLAKLNKGWNKVIQSRFSHGLSERFGFSDYDVVKEAYLSLPQKLREQVNIGLISLINAKVMYMPDYFLRRMSIEEIAKQRIMALINQLSRRRSYIDFSHSNDIKLFLATDLQEREYNFIYQ